MARSRRGARRPSASTRSRTACSRSGSARATRSGSSARHSSSGRSSTTRSRCVGAVTAAIYANSSPQRLRLRPRPRRGDRRARGGRRAAREARERGIRSSAHVLTFADLDELAARGARYAAEHPHALDEAVAAIDEDDLFTFIYTSGTTGPPKACMIRHRNDYEMVSIVDEPARTSRSRATRCSSASRSRTTSGGDAPRGPARRLHDRVLRRPARGRRRAAAGPADGAPERAAASSRRSTRRAGRSSSGRRAPSGG